MKKILKKSTALILSIFLAIVVTGCSQDEGNQVSSSSDNKQVVENTVSFDEPLPSDYEGTLTIWGWDTLYYETVTQGFQEMYPNVKFEYTPVAGADLLQKYQTSLATGTELPDIAWAIIESRAKLFELDMWEDLSSAPYNFDINDVYENVHARMVNSKGQVCGIEQQLTPAGMAYRRDLTLEYFGTDDPKELEAMFPTWDAFIEKGIEVKEKSNGEVYMMQSVGDVVKFVGEQNSLSWVSGDVVNATKAFEYPLKIATRFRDTGVADKLDQWSPAWYASYGEGKHIFAGCATWSIEFVIGSSDPEGKDTGRWGLMNAPEGNINWGGTTLGISKTCTDKRLAWEFIKYATLSTEGAEKLNANGVLTSAKKPYIEKPELNNMTSSWFGEQNLGEFYLTEIIPNIEIRPMNLDDNLINDAVLLVTKAINNDKELDAEEALDLLIEELELQLPDYKIE